MTKLNASKKSRLRDVLMQKDVRLTVVGKVFKSNRMKVLALNRTLSEYFRLVK